jgi:hypothetical protein
MATKTQTGKVEIVLNTPLVIDGAKVPKLTMREPTVKDQLLMDEVTGGAATKELSMMANLCMVTPDDLVGMSLRDYKKVQAAFLGFTN